MEGGGYAQASDIEIHANELIRMREWLEETIAHHTGRDVEQVRKDIERDKILTAAAGAGVRPRRPGAGEPQGRHVPVVQPDLTPGRAGPPAWPDRDRRGGPRAWRG